METLRKAAESVRAMWAGLSAAQRAAVAVLALALAVAVAWGASSAGSAGERTLVDSKTPYDEQEQVRAKLAELGIPHKVRDGGIWVAAERIDEARLAIAPVIDEAPIGASSIWDTPDDKQARTVAAVQYRLARMMGRIDGVRRATVQLTLPQRSEWRVASKEGSAAIMVELRPGAKMTLATVNAIAQMVQGGTGIKTEHIRVIGPAGPYVPGADDAMASGGFHEHALQMGREISRMIEQLLPIEARVMTTVKLSPKHEEESRTTAGTPVPRKIEGRNEENFVPTDSIKSMTPLGAKLDSLSVAVVIPVNAQTTTVPQQEPQRGEYLAEVTRIVSKATGAEERNIAVTTLAVPVPATVAAETAWGDTLPSILEYAGKGLLVLLVLVMGYAVWRIVRASVDRTAVEAQESAQPVVALAGLAPAEAESARLRAGASEAALRDPQQAAEAVRRLMER